MKKVLITGMDSFTGKHLSQYLKNLGYDIYGTSLFENAHKKYQCDITNKDDILKVFTKVIPDFVIHLSGISFTAHGKADDFYKVNIIGTMNILDSLLELNINPKKIVIASSATVYGNQGLEILDESLCCKPANHYGASKYSMECLTQGYFNKLNIIISRPFNYTGIGQAEHFLIPKIIKHFKENKSVLELGNIDVIREFNDVSFVCEVYKRFLESDKKSEIVNIATNRGIKLLNVIKLMNKITGYEIEVKVNPAFVRKDEIKSLTGNSEKLFEMIGKIEQKSFELTLKEMYEA